MNLEGFHRTSMRSIESGKRAMDEDWKQGFAEASKGADFRGMFEKAPFVGDQKFFEDVASALAARSVRLAKQTVDSSALVFAHTLLDEAVSECCAIAFKAKPGDWFRFVEKKKVEVGILWKKSSSEILEEEAWKFVSTLGREALAKRLQLLNQVCIPKVETRPIPTAWIRPEALDRFDQMRHKIVHGSPFRSRGFKIEDELFFAKQAGFSTFFLIQASLHLLDKDTTAFDSRRLPRLFVALRREFPELLDLLQKQTKMRRVSND